MTAGLALDDAHDVGLLHDEVFGAVDLDFGARPLAEQHDVAGLDVDRDELAALVAAARADGDDFALHGLFLGGVGDDDATLGLGVFLDPAHDHAVVQRTELHGDLHDKLFVSACRACRASLAHSGKQFGSFSVVGTLVGRVLAHFCRSRERNFCRPTNRP